MAAAVKNALRVSGYHFVAAAAVENALRVVAKDFRISLLFVFGGDFCSINNGGLDG